MKRRMLWRLQVGVARMQQAIGRTGCVGLGLIATAVLWLALQPRPVTPAMPATADPMPLAVLVGAASDDEALPPSLPVEADVPLLLTLLQQAAQTQGVAWSAAEYRRLPAGEDWPEALEVRCAIKGTYPSLRRVISSWLDATPAVALREVSMTRAATDTAELEAKLSLVLFLRTASGPSAEHREPGQRP